MSISAGGSLPPGSLPLRARTVSACVLQAREKLQLTTSVGGLVRVPRHLGFSAFLAHQFSHWQRPRRRLAQSRINPVLVAWIVSNPRLSAAAIPSVPGAGARDGSGFPFDRWPGVVRVTIVAVPTAVLTVTFVNEYLAR